LTPVRPRSSWPPDSAVELLHLLGVDVAGWFESQSSTSTRKVTDGVSVIATSSRTSRHDPRSIETDEEENT